jgi:broad specificity polyphosphatase/5'/3'-nucleotidase SurE
VKHPFGTVRDVRLLLTSDEGHRSPGLHALRERAVGAGHEVVVAGPLEDFMGFGSFDPPPAAVLSGVHPGALTGLEAVDSATVAGPLAALHVGVPGLAVSLDITTACRPHWDTAAAVAVALVPWIVECDPPLVLNVNVPDVPAHGVRGVCAAGLSAEGWSDRAVLEEGFVAVTPLGVADTATDHQPDVLGAVAVVERALADLALTALPERV